MSRLPSGYIEVEHIECTGTQYINTGFIPNQDTRIVCECMYKGGTGVYGARSSVSSRNFSMRVINSAWQIGYGNGVTTSPIECDTTEWHLFDHNKNALYVDGVLAVEREYATFSAPYPVAIGAIRAGSMYYGQGCYRIFRIYDNGVLVRDFVPCQNPDGEAGVYDLVGGAFYANAGTGEFVTGNIHVIARMITDRTSQDVDRVKILSEKAWQDMTADERSEWLSPMKGSYNYTDLNRVEEAVAYVAGRLNAFGYLPVMPVTRTWSAEDIPTADELAKYFWNVSRLRQAIAVWASTPDAPSNADEFGINEANALEQILVDVDLVLTRISQAWFYLGDLYSAEV